MPDAQRPDVTVLVPALNEEETIAEVIERLLGLPLRVEVIVIDDGSTDRTTEILKGYKDRIRVLRNEERSGKGNAIRQALPFASGRATIIQDADLEYSPEEIPKLVNPIIAGEATVVFGTRFAHGLPKDMALPNKIVNLMLAATVRVLFRSHITDEATCYKAFRTELLSSLNLQCRRFEFCPEVIAKSLRRGQAIIEIPISYVPRSKAAGKKIRWTDAPDAFWTLIKYRFVRF
jgi:glycosyltransferase involved in cell wall biosynthesis